MTENQSGSRQIDTDKIHSRVRLLVCHSAHWCDLIAGSYTLVHYQTTTSLVTALCSLALVQINPCTINFFWMIDNDSRHRKMAIVRIKANKIMMRHKLKVKIFQDSRRHSNLNVIVCKAFLRLFVSRSISEPCSSVPHTRRLTDSIEKAVLWDSNKRKRVLLHQFVLLYFGVWLFLRAKIFKASVKLQYSLNDTLWLCFHCREMNTLDHKSVITKQSFWVDLVGDSPVWPSIRMDLW